MVLGGHKWAAEMRDAAAARQVVRFEGAMPPREQLFWNLALQHLLASAPDDAAVSAMFERLAANAVNRPPLHRHLTWQLLWQLYAHCHLGIVWLPTLQRCHTNAVSADAGGKAAAHGAVAVPEAHVPTMGHAAAAAAGQDGRAGHPGASARCRHPTPGLTLPVELLVDTCGFGCVSVHGWRADDPSWRMD